MRLPPLIRTLALLPALASLTGGPAPATARTPPARGQQGPVIMQPLDLGLQEEAGVSLLILDVEVLDKDGRPLPGLTADDFEVYLDGKRWPLVAADDFCACGSEPAMAAAGTGTGLSAPPSPGTTPEAAAAAAAAEDPGSPQQRRFVLYIDFSQLQLSGRSMAQEHVGTWLRQSMQAGDLAMLVAYSTAAGLETIVQMTGDRDEIREGVARVFADEEFMDPFPEALRRRRFECDECMRDCVLEAKQSGARVVCERGCCGHQAMQDSWQGRRSLEALDLLLTTLEGVPGHKDVILFNQNGLVYPAQLYPVLDDREAFEVGNQENLIKRVAASATAARTAVHTANLPATGNLATGLSEGARDLGTRLADYTGGTTNRAIADLDGLLQAAGRRCCVYRLSINSPEDPPRRPMRVRVMARGRRLPGDYRIQFYSPEQKWFRQARAALAAPAQRLDPPITVTLTPTYLRTDRWVVEIQAAFALRDLELVPSVSQRVGRWRVGALLQTEDGENDWEMLSMARATLQGLGETGLEAVHQRRIGSLKPGSYRLRLFVEDAQRNRFSAMEVTLDLPAEEDLDAEQPWLHGPRVSRRTDRRLSLGLPFTSSEPPIPTPVGPPAVGQIPTDHPVVPAGVALEFTSVLCPRPADLEDPETTSVVLRADTPIARLPAPQLRSSGACITITDQVETALLPPGGYEYQLILHPAGAAPVTAAAPFSVTTPVPQQPD